MRAQTARHWLGNDGRATTARSEQRRRCTPSTERRRAELHFEERSTSRRMQQKQSCKQRRHRSQLSSLNWGLFVLLLLMFLNCKFSYALESDGNNNETEASAAKHKERQSTKPNIVIILIDDMGYNDVSYHGSDQIITRNIDALAYNGVILNRHYTPNLCTPSRATLLTGKYPIHTGTQHFVIVNDEPWGLPLSERLMPEIFRDAGYSTNLIGKWHLGFWKKQHTPTMRGFDYHYGYFTGYIDYYNHEARMLNRNYSAGLDFRRNLKPWPNDNGTYATDAFTKEAVRVIKTHDTRKPLFLLLSHLAVHSGNEDVPMQAPEEEVAKFGHISNKERRIYAGMVSSLDESVGRTIRALDEKGILNNTIVLLYSDNGAPTVGIHANSGSNYPFRGQKESPWEGAVRSAGVIWSPLLEKRSYVSNQPIHASDWLPTLASAAGVEIPQHLKLDGMDQWNTLSQNLPPQSRSLLHVLDEIDGYTSYTRGSYKYVNGSSFDGQYDGWLGELAATSKEPDPLAPYYIQTVLSSEVQSVIGHSNTLTGKMVEKLRAQATPNCPHRPGMDANEMYQCNPLKAPCLFDIDDDPCERYNLAQFQPATLKDMQDHVESLRSTAVPSARVHYEDPLANPALHHGTWEWWDTLKNDSSSQSQCSSFYSGFWLSLCLTLQWLLG